MSCNCTLHKFPLISTSTGRKFRPVEAALTFKQKGTITMLSNNILTLRPTKHDDIADYRRWLIDEPNPNDWDVAWDGDDDDEAYIQSLQDDIGEEEDIYYHLEVDNEKSQHIGWVSAYFLDEQRTKLCVGIDLPTAERRKGYGENALALYVSYLFSLHNIDAIYTNTLSGNEPMVNLAKKVGFEVDHITPAVVTLRGQAYDGLRFGITREVFFTKYSCQK